MLDMRMVTAGIDAYTITDQCTRLAKGVTEHKNVYVRSRRTRDTQGRDDGG